MNAVDPGAAKSIFLAALDQPTPQQMGAYLDEACAGDLPLRRRVEELLRGHEQVGSLLERPAIDPQQTACFEPVAEKPGMVIGRYKLLEQIGEGGMGVVFMAEQLQPVRRKVALKIVKPGMDSQQVIARFEAERQALALMDHPNIARVLDGGATSEVRNQKSEVRGQKSEVRTSESTGRRLTSDLCPLTSGAGRPYFVMELVRGIPITEYCDQYQVTLRQRLELFVQVCHAVQHAHQKGIIHRDIKPSNVMVTLHDGTPVPKVIDFGVAKAIGHALTERTMFTNFAQLIGTPLYMSPEQAALGGLDIDTRSDVYSLGVLLYEMLTGRTPFESDRLRKAGYDEMRRIIREEDPPRPSDRVTTLKAACTTDCPHCHGQPRDLVRSLRGELDWIVMKCLEKDRARRYESASALAEDVERYQHNEPVHACPPSVLYRLRKFVQRRKALVFSAAVALVVPLVALLASTLLVAGAYQREKQQHELADEQRQLAEQQEALARRQKDLAEQQKTEAERQRQEAEALLFLAIQEPHFIGTAFGPDGNFYVSSGGLSAVLRYDGKTGEFLNVFVPPGSGGLVGPEGIVFGPDADGDRTSDLYVASGDNDSIRRYSGATGAFLDAVVAPRVGGLEHPTGLAVGPGNNLYVASFDNSSVLRYSGKDGKFLGAFVPARSGGLRHPQATLFGPDGNLYVVSFSSHAVLRYDGKDGRFLGEFVAARAGGLIFPENAAFGPDGALYVISNTLASSVLRYDGRTGAFLNEFISPGGGGLAVAQALVFGPTGDLFVSNHRRDSVSRFDTKGRFRGPFASYNRADMVGSLTEILRKQPTRSPGTPEYQPMLRQLYRSLAVYYQERGEYGKAAADFERAGDEGLHSTHHKRRALAYFQAKKYDEALKSIAKAVRQRPDDFSNLTWLPLVEVAKGPSERLRVGLLELADTTMEMTRGAPEAYAARAAIYDAFGRQDGARADFEKAVQLEPENAALWIARACLVCARDARRAQPTAGAAKGIQMTPGCWDLWNLQGVARLGGGKAAEHRDDCALIFMKMSQTEKPTEAHWLAWGCTLAPEVIADWPQAIALAEKAARSDPKSQSYLSTWGAVLYRAGRLEQALARLAEADALAQRPSETREFSPAYTWFFLAMTHHGLGHREEAKNWLAKGASWTAKTDREDGHGTGAPWKRRLTLKLLRDEAEKVLKTPTQTPPAAREKETKR